MFAKRKRRKLAERHLDEAIAAEWAARGVIPSRPGPQPFPEALREAGLPEVGEHGYSVIAVEVVRSAVASLSDEDRALVSSRSAQQPQEGPSEPPVDLSEFPLMTKVLGEDALREMTISLQTRAAADRDRWEAIAEEVEEQIMMDLPDREDEWPAEFVRRMTRIHEEEFSRGEEFSRLEQEKQAKRAVEWAMPTAMTILVRTSDGQEGELLMDRESQTTIICGLC
jgi:hypothetical protein